MAGRVVLIPGLGADHRLFDGITLDPCAVLRTDWIAHRNGESLSAYSARFAAHHAICRDDILVGVSLGGIVAGSIAHLQPVRRCILVSSCTHISQLSPLIAACSPLSSVMPFAMARWLPRSLLPRHRQLAVTMFAAHDMRFIRWACAAIMSWPGVPRPAGSASIHGTADRMFPIRRQPHVDIAIAGGGHLMVMDRAAEVEAAIRSLLAAQISSSLA